MTAKNRRARIGGLASSEGFCWRMSQEGDKEKHKDLVEKNV